MRTVFFGTPEFAVPTLSAMVAAGYAPLRVVTQPARPAGRGRRLEEPPVARWARERGRDLIQPETVRRRSFRRALAALEPDVAVVVAFGQIFRAKLLALPAHGCVNLHASLLPRYRGAAPIQAAIAAGERVTGVTTMRMTEGLDSGPILRQAEVAIGPRETAPELAARLAERGAELVVETLRGLARGTLDASPQDENLASYAPRLTKADGEVDWRLEAGAIFDRLRAYTPWPGQTSTLRGKRVKLLRVEPLAGRTDEAPGTLLPPADGLAVACGAGTILGLERLQIAGKRPVSGRDFLHGERLEGGERFAAPES